jgi:cytochrome oxidase Cu insertion factor (SCO1/SenC/PrrC family)
MRRTDLVLRVWCYALLLAVGCVLGSSASCSGPVAQVAQAAPTAGSPLNVSALKLLDLDSKPFDLQKSSEGQVHVVLFTRSDCPVSNQLAPEVRMLFEKLHPKGVDFYLIYVDPNEKPEAIREHLREYQYPCTGIRDPEHTLVAQTGATVTPEAVVFNRDWHIAYRGRINNEYIEVGKSRTTAVRHDLQEAIEATLADQPVPEPVSRHAIGCYIGDLK